MYEVQLGSKGVMQVGWGTAQCRFNQQYGVGKSECYSKEYICVTIIICYAQIIFQEKISLLIT